MSPRQAAQPASPEPALPSVRTLVERGRLLRLMESGTSGPMTLLSAPAGAGKSTLVAQWAAARDMRGVAWVDNDDLTGRRPRSRTGSGDTRTASGEAGAPVIVVVDLSDQDDLDDPERTALDRAARLRRTDSSGWW